VRAGYGQYFMGTSPLYLLAAAALKLPRYPVLLGSVAIVWGYIASAFRGESRYDDPGFRRFLRRYQHDCLRHGKREATRRTDEAKALVWWQAHKEAAGAGEASR